MGQYIEINNYSGLGKMGISRNVLVSIASKAVSNIKGASLSEKESFLFQVAKPVKVQLSKNGIASIQVSVNLSADSKVQDVCLKIQEEVTSAIKMMCETIPISVRVCVESVG